MAQIAMILDSAGGKNALVVQKLRSFVPVPVAEIISAMTAQQPVFVRKLFDRKNPEFPLQLLEFMKWLESNSISYRAFQVLDHDQFESSRCNRYFAVDAEKLNAIIATRSASLEEQQRIGRLEDGISDDSSLD